MLDLQTAWPPMAVPIEGIHLPAATTTVLPIGHRASVTVGLAHATTGGGGRLPDRGCPTPWAVARGWVGLSQRASRLDTPRPGGDRRRRGGAVRDLVFGGLADPETDDAGFLVGVGELVRTG